MESPERQNGRRDCRGTQYDKESVSKVTAKCLTSETSCCVRWLPQNSGKTKRLGRTNDWPCLKNFFFKKRYKINYSRPRFPSPRTIPGFECLPIFPVKQLMSE
uniref:Uncharacterized protein n=1 Tax=Cyclopterus lumpus TaxID=8103 RepID=A0A8C2ZED4_CYCLU